VYYEFISKSNITEGELTMSNELAYNVLETTLSVFRSQKSLGDLSIGQLDEESLHWAPDKESNNIAIIVKHVSGNMLSRWTDFLTTDGEKPNRNRDDEFMDDIDTLASLTQTWEKGWSVLFHALEELQPEDLLRTVTIRGQAHTVIQAINRQISHYGYHVGQIVYIAKAYKSDRWQTLSIAKSGLSSKNKK
jgi:hypothetical protein